MQAWSGKRLYFVHFSRWNLRCLFISQMLLEAGAPVDVQNHLGWTPLHEACFYNRIEAVKLLLSGGANASLRTRGGALPYHFAGLQIVRSMLRDKGGEKCVPSEEDVVDLATVIRELSARPASSQQDSSAPSVSGESPFTRIKCLYNTEAMCVYN